MDVKRILRFVVCFVLVCALVINISPIKTYAALDWALLGVAAELVIAGAMIGTGLKSGSEAQLDVFKNAVDDCYNFLTLNYDFVTDDEKIAVWATGNPDCPYMVDYEAIEAVRRWLYESGTVSKIESDDGYSYFNGVRLPSFPSDMLSALSDGTMCAIIVQSIANGGYTLRYGSGAFSVAPYPYDDCDWIYYYSPDGSRCTFSDYQIESETWTKSSGSWVVKEEKMGFLFSNWNLIWTSSDPIVSDGQIITLDGLALAEMANEEDDFDTGYPVWSAQSVSIPGTDTGEETRIVPIGLGQTLDDTIGLTQSQVWAGSSTYVDSTTDTDTGTDTSTEVGLLEGIWNAIKSLPKSIADAFSDVISFVKSWPQTIADWFTKVIEAIEALVDSLAQAIKDVLAAVFIPAEGYVDAKVSTLTDKYVFADSIAQTGMELKHFLVNLGAKPPIIYIDLGAFTGDHSYGGRVKFLDLTWYSQYKDTMDVILSAILWLWFAWRMMLALPGIIQGTSGFWSKPENPQETQALVIAKDWYEKR